MKYPAAINDPASSPQERLAALREYERTGRGQSSPPPGGSGEINNHIHTIYSFSPYTPSMAALMARDAGLEAAGSVDHDSIAAAEEMIAACAALGIGGCTGFELRVSFKTGSDGKASAFADRKINNPDSEGIVYMTVQGIPKPALAKVRDFLGPIQEKRRERTMAMTAAANAILAGAGLEEIDFGRDIYCHSKAAEGGEITERHLLAAAADKLIKKFGRGPALPEGLERCFAITPPAKIAALLSDPGNPHYLYDLLGILKSAFLPRIFIQPDEEECIPAKTAVDFASSIGAIPAYAYLGDVGESPTGDKRAEKFEDEYLDELFDELSRIGFKAVTYMPPRNSKEQLRRVRRLCAERDFMEISGVDINSSRQSFNCPEVLQDDFRHLIGTTWALIAHERLSSADPSLNLFAADNPLASLSLQSRIDAYAAAGRGLDLHKPEESAYTAAREMREGKYTI
ncbi:PHP domain-containing protein [Treponema sp. OttesenSCG-928-L16]|nr:PHP domain-containing protein [Treponema sp. OttesenSCG-928-L16]